MDEGNALRVLFLGTPEFAVPTLRALLASRHRVVGVVTQPDRPRGRGQQVAYGPVKVLALAAGLPVWQPDRIKQPGLLDEWRALDPDLAVVAAYGKILPADFLALPRLGAVNVHASLLPRWRGASPVHHAVASGDAETGVTIMRVVQALDAGAMFDRVVHPIGPEDTAGEVEAVLAAVGAPLLVDVVDRLAAGTAIETPQDERLVTYAPRLTKDDGVIDWGREAPALQCFVRGMQPWPGATTWMDRERWLVRRAAVVDGPAEGVAAGTIVEARGDRLIVACGGGSRLAILELQPEGKRPMPARALLAGRAVPPGTTLGPQPPA
jgi:methionyl-tRNA formyltransferase